MLAGAERLTTSPTTFDAARAMLHVERAGARSVVRRAYAPSPLKLLQPRNHGSGAWVFTSTYGGGLVDGDHMAMDVEIGAGAMALISTQASTKIYRSPRGVSNALSARVMGAGVLIVAPDPVVPFAGSRYRQEQQFVLDESASLVSIDWLTSGRRAMGERWAFDDYFSRIRIERAGRPVVYDALRLHPADGGLADRLGRFDVLATVVITGPAFAGEPERLVASVAGLPMSRRPDFLISAARLSDSGCILRMAGRDAEAVGHALRAHLRFLPSLLGDDPWKRKW